MNRSKPNSTLEQQDFQGMTFKMKDALALKSHSKSCDKNKISLKQLKPTIKEQNIGVLLQVFRWSIKVVIFGSTGAVV